MSSSACTISLENSSQPWAEAGYECYCIDLQHPSGETRDGNITFVGGDMREWRPARKIIDRIVFAASLLPV